MQRAVASLEGPVLHLEIAPRLAMNPSPLLLALTSLLQLSSQELEEAIDREAADNPALDRSDTGTCPICDGELGAACPRCRPPTSPGNGHVGRSTTGDMDVAVRPTPQQVLVEEVRLLLPADEILLAEFVVGSLDHRGFLPEGAAGVATHLGVARDRVDRVIGALRVVGPPGIGAANVRECLIAQLDRLEGSRGIRDDPDQVALLARARAIVREHLEALGRGRFAAIARALGATVEEVEAARAFMRARLSPYPSAGLADDQPITPMLPDVLVRQVRGSRDQLQVEVVDERRFRLRVDPLYQLLSDMSAATNPRGLSAETRRHVRQAVRRASLFIECVADRNRTLRRIAERAVEAQRGFVLGGPRFLRPLTRARLAQVIGVHESTVSRATSGKHVMLPSGRIVAFREFFDASLGARDALRRIIEEEQAPLSDRELAARLDEMGYRVARRTVAKYRLKLGLLPGAVRGHLRTRPSIA
jgi:RNA polymerase sigma-54 factor